MTWTTPTNVTDYTTFLQNVVGITPVELPISDPIIGYTLTVAQATVLQALQCVSPIIYVLATYNLATDYLIRWANDQPGQTYFTGLRRGYGINSFTAGVIQSTADVSTSESMVVPDFFKTITMGNLQNLQTPYGRQYLAWAQEFGTLWGLT